MCLRKTGTLSHIQQEWSLSGYIHTTCTYLSINNRCKSIKVSYIKSPKQIDNVVLNEYYNQKINIHLTKEQLEAYNNHIKKFEKEKLNGVDTHSILKEGENTLDSNASLQFYAYFWLTIDERFKLHRNTIVQVNVI